MAQIQVEVRIHIAWWARWYLAGVVLMARITGLEPDITRVCAWMMRAVRVRVIPIGQPDARRGSR